MSMWGFFVPYLGGLTGCSRVENIGMKIYLGKNLVVSRKFFYI